MWKYFKDLERTMSVRELNDLATEIAEAYADRFKELKLKE